jgi:hypothetical protein
MESSMNKTLNIKEIAVSIIAESLNPVILTPEFLKYRGIVPSSWELTRQPILTAAASQVVFQTGVSILAQPNRIIFAESLMATEPMDAKTIDAATPAIAQRYIDALPQANYQAVGINFTGFVRFDQDEAANYLTDTLLAPGPWHTIGETPLRAALRLTYTLKQAQLNLDITEAKLQLAEEELPVVLFAANFDHQLQSNPTERVQELNQVIDYWPNHLKTYQDIVNTKFLQPSPVSSPAA